MTAKITLIHDNGAGDIITVVIQSNSVLTKDEIVGWFKHTALVGLGFNPEQRGMK